MSNLDTKMRHTCDVSHFGDHRAAIESFLEFPIGHLNLLAWCIEASDAFPQRYEEAFEGAYSREALMWYLGDVSAGHCIFKKNENAFSLWRCGQSACQLGSDLASRLASKQAFSRPAMPARQPPN